MVRYIPERGDIVWLDFFPSSGHEQDGRRPAFVVSPSIYNEKSKLALVCPITSKQKNYAFEVLITGSEIKGVILSDQLKSVDWKGRKAKFIEVASASVTEDVLNRVLVLVKL